MPIINPDTYLEIERQSGARAALEALQRAIGSTAPLQETFVENPHRASGLTGGSYYLVTIPDTVTKGVFTKPAPEQITDAVDTMGDLPVSDSGVTPQDAYKACLRAALYPLTSFNIVGPESLFAPPELAGLQVVGKSPFFAIPADDGTKHAERWHFNNRAARRTEREINGTGLSALLPSVPSFVTTLGRRARNLLHLNP